MYFKKTLNMDAKIIDVDEMEKEDYAVGVMYFSKENKRYCFMTKNKLGFRVGMGRGDVPKTHPEYSKNTGNMTFKQAQRVMYDFMRGEL